MKFFLNWSGGRIFVTLCFLKFFGDIFIVDAIAFRDATHKKINVKCSEMQTLPATSFNLDNFFKKSLGFVNGIDEPLDDSFDFSSFTVRPITAGKIIENAGPLEDETPRYFRHFHDGIENYGLWNYFDSALFWAQKDVGGQGYSWNDARHYYYAALTSTTTDQRNANFARAFRSVGQVMHLVEDMAVPEHTRNDAHPLSPGIELYIEDNLAHDANAFSGVLGAPFFFDFRTLQTTPSAFAGAGAPVPVANLFDTNIYDGSNPNTTVANTVGLAEYSNANFLSTDTNPVTSSLSIPPLLANTSPTEFDIVLAPFPGQTFKRWYYVKNRDGETAGGAGYKLTAMSVFSYYWQNLHGTTDTITVPILDAYVYDDYAKLLLPRATGYAATLLNYFFRGDIELSLPDRGIYSLSTPEQGGFGTVRIKAKNVTPNGEEMPSGSIELVVKYKTTQDDPFQGVPITVSADDSYMVVPEANGRTRIPRDTPVELVFNLDDSNLPLNATDLTLQVVYHGQMGVQTTSGFVGETDGVAVGFKDISEPTPFDYINGMDLICLNDAVVATGSAEAMSARDVNGEPIYWNTDVYPDALKNLYLKFSAAVYPVSASASNFDISLATLAPGSYLRVYYLANPLEASTKVSHQVLPVPTDARDIRMHNLSNYIFSVKGLVNAEVNEDGVMRRITPPMTMIRGLPVWGSLHWTKKGYPATTSCSTMTATIPLAGPVPLGLVVP